MRWDEIIKVQITDTKQGVKTSARKLPEPEDDDCNRELQRLYEELIRIANQGLENLKDIGNTNEYWRAKDYYYKEISQLDDDGEELNLSIKLQFEPFSNEKTACDVLNNLKKHWPSIPSSTDDLRCVIDEEWEGRYHDILFNAWARGNNIKGSFFVQIETADDWGKGDLLRFNNLLVKPILQKLKNP